MDPLNYRASQLSLAIALAVVALHAEARVERVEVLARTDVLEGKSFGEAGAYERLMGKVHFKVKPEDPHNRLIVDLDKAERDEKGEVGFAADFYVLKPKEATRGSGTAILEIPNRGGKRTVQLLQNAAGSPDPKTEAEFGDGFLMRRGVTVIALGWQWDVREEGGLLRLFAPIARDGEKPITGLVRSDFMVPEKTTDHPLGHMISGQIGGTEYPVSDPDDPANVLTVRDAPLAERQAVERSEWQFARTVDGTLTPNDRSLHLSDGFEPGKIYEVVYRAKDPVVVGLGFAAVRDFVSYLKHDETAIAPAQRVYALGISQSGRFLRHLLFEGFNADEAGKQVFDGMFIHVAGAGIGSFNHRFAQPSRDGQPTTALFYPTDLFPFADIPQKEPENERNAGLLDRAKADKVLPKIFHTNTSYEYWSRAGSLIHTSPDGKRDLPLMDNVRIYLLTGLQHFSGPFPPTHGTNPVLLAQNLPNPNPVVWFWRALFVAMDEWVKEGTPPPRSRYPQLEDGMLVGREKLAFPEIRGVSVPDRVHEALRLDFGPQWKKRIITKQPPAVGKPFPSFVPQVNDDGNEMAGVRLPQLSVPLATYTGWNLRDPKIGLPEERISFLGSYLPFKKTKREAEEAGDPRRPIEERYKSREEYLKQFSDATEKLTNDRFLLKEDSEALVKRAGEEWDYVAK